MYLFLDFEGVMSCRSLMNEELHVCGELKEWLRKLHHSYEIELDDRSVTTQQLCKRTSELEDAMLRRQIELSRIVEEIAGTYADCDRLIAEAREAVKHTQEVFELGIEG